MLTHLRVEVKTMIFFTFCAIIKLDVENVTSHNKSTYECQLLPEFDGDTSVYKIEPIKIKDDYDLFLTRIIITKDDILRYADKRPECKNARLKESILVDIGEYRKSCVKRKPSSMIK